MPIYEYGCAACGHEFEVMQRITDRPIRKCEACGRLKAKRRISQTSFVLKGTGWYTTDYAGKKAHGGSEGESTAASAPSSASEAPAATESSKPAASETPAAKPAEPKKSPKKAASA